MPVEFKIMYVCCGIFWSGLNVGLLVHWTAKRDRYFGILSIIGAVSGIVPLLVWAKDIFVK